MSAPSPARTPLIARLVALALALAPLSLRAQSDGSGNTTASWDISELLDRLPDFSPFGKLTEKTPFPVRLYVRPRVGDFVHRDYVRIPVGAKAKLTDNYELHTELESYFTHGLKDTAGYGVSRYRLGGRYDVQRGSLHPIGYSTGFDFDTPLSRPPTELTDGHRHLLPYITASKMLVPDYNLVGYAGITLDFLSQTPLRANFGHNQLHSNSVTFSSGITRDYKRFRVALTGTWGTTKLLSDENHNVFALRPDVLIPLTKKPGPGARTHLLLIIGGEAVNGPDGTELGIDGSVRIEFAVQSGRNED